MTVTREHLIYEAKRQLEVCYKNTNADVLLDQGSSKDIIHDCATLIEDLINQITIDDTNMV
mgnify:CR=1 FL=1|jgi:hypothetical protein